MKQIMSIIFSVMMLTCVSNVFAEGVNKPAESQQSDSQTMSGGQI